MCTHAQSLILFGFSFLLEIYFSLLPCLTILCVYLADPNTNWLCVCYLHGAIPTTWSCNSWCTQTRNSYLHCEGKGHTNFFFSFHFPSGRPVWFLLMVLFLCAGIFTCYRVFWIRDRSQIPYTGASILCVSIRSLGYCPWWSFRQEHCPSPSGTSTYTAPCPWVHGKDQAKEGKT